MIDFAANFEAIAHLAGLCPDCGAAFRISDSRPFVPNHTRRTPLDKLEAQERQINEALADLDELEQGLRERARTLGLNRAQKRLRKIDKAFATRKIDPHDVKVLAHPIEYVAFDGMTKGRIKRVTFCAEPARSSADEKLLASVERTMARGNVEFLTIRVNPEGNCEFD